MLIETQEPSMAANKFATMLHRSTHRTVVILVYAVLEWILILMLLLNSFATYLIIKFASYFALKPPCMWCSRVDRLFEKNEMNPYGNLICESHATEFSNMYYCSNHQNLTSRPEYICRNCLPSPSFSLNNEANSAQNGNCQKVLRCSCCKEDLSRISYLLFKTSWGIFEYMKKGFSIPETEMDEKNGGDCEEREECHLVLSDSEEKFSSGPSSGKDCPLNFQVNSMNRSFEEASKIQLSYVASRTVELMDTPIQNNEYLQDFDRIIPLEWTDSSTSGSRSSSVSQEENMMAKLKDQRGKQGCEDEEGRGETTEQILFCMETYGNQAEEMIPLQSLQQEEALTDKGYLGSKKSEEDIKQESKEIEFCDGSVISEEEDIDEALTIERLKAELKAERLALSALYMELEEERNASAIAANQTMAMITRLQEEKAALQIEAMQNQRMMEEQAEYDQEALQLLNELLMKRDKEKLELENELENYRLKFLDSEGKEKVKLMSGSSSASCSISNESLNETVFDLKNNSSTLDDSMVEFEVERLSILDELRELEEKLFTLADDLDEDSREGQLEGKDVRFMGKTLLPLYDIKCGEGDVDEDDEISHSTWTRSSFAAYSNSYEGLEKKVGIEEEIDCVQYKVYYSS